MLAKVEYPLEAQVLAVMVSLKIQAKEFTDTVKELLQRIYDQYER